MKKIFPLLFCILPLFGKYPYRDIKYPPIQLEEETRILLLGCDRTGSTLIHNVLKYLFEDKESDHCNYNSKVIKLHNFTKTFPCTLNPKTTILATTIRDPLNIVASRKCAYKNIKKTSLECYDPLNQIPSIRKNTPAFLSFRYEDFENNNFDYIFSIIEKGLDITIPDLEKKKIQELFSIQNMRKIAKQYHDFRQCNPELGVHGNHINSAHWSRDLTYKEAKLAFNKNFALREAWGYDNCKAAIEIEKFRFYKKEGLR